ncbi:hypothetical protein QQS21_003652 [Conoideocrella luteorostrata]|uniref:Kinesin light chain n=1 Tax=Conoideocrella luteorostrata TaxID=1105319 RepID=A0AAJ0CSZ7_9HYPO|nr:hypothetical protein QQS21_003652 [Conoideocrella luteorostrata]
MAGASFNESVSGRNVVAGLHVADGGNFTANFSNVLNQPFTPSGPLHVIPFPRNEDFIRRSDVVSALDSLLSSNGEYCSAALWGFGGSGKTQIALQYAYRRCAPSCSVFWVHADSEITFLLDYKTIARKLCLAGELEGKDLMLAVRDRIEALPRWVFVVDNTDDLKLFGVSRPADSPSSLLDFVPRGFGGTVLWTSRDERIAGTLVGGRRGLHVQNMTVEEAIDLLRSNMNKTFTDVEHDDAQNLVQELHLLPLLISQAGAYMRRTTTPIREYRSQLLSDKERWHLISNTEFDRHRRADVSNNLLHSLALSINRVRHEHEEAYKTIGVLAYLDNQHIPEEVIKAAASFHKEDGQIRCSEQSVDTLHRLMDLSFITTQNVNGVEREFEMHKLVQEAARFGHQDSSLGKPGDGKYFASVAITVILDLFPEYTPNSRHLMKQCEKFLPHAVKVANLAEFCGMEYEIIQILARVSSYLLDRGSWTQSESINKRLLSLRSTTLGKKHPDTLASMNDLAYNIFIQGYYSEAEVAVNNTLELTREVLGEENLGTIDTISLLARVHDVQGRYKEAEEIRIKVLELQREVLGEKHPDTIIAMGSLASTYHMQGLYKEAEKVEIKVLELRREVLGEKHPDTVTAMGNLASTCHMQGRYKEAEQVEIKVLELQREVLGEKHPHTIIAMGSLAKTYHMQGRYKEAEQVEIKVLELQREVLGEKHPDTVTAMGSLARTYHMQGRYKEAEQVEIKVLELQREVLVEKHPETITSMGNLACTYHMQGRYKEAEQIKIKVLELRREVLGEKHPHTIISMGNLARTYHMQGLYKKAEQVEIKVLKLRREVLGKKHPDTIKAMGNLARTYHMQGRYKEAKRIKIKVLELRREDLGEKHPHTITAIGNLAKNIPHARPVQGSGTD